MTLAPLVPRTFAQWCVAALLTIGVVLLIVDHWAHVFGVLPYLVILACPLMHLFMHHGHGHHDHAKTPQGADDAKDGTPGSA